MRSRLRASPRPLVQNVDRALHVERQCEITHCETVHDRHARNPKHKRAEQHPFQPRKTAVDRETFRKGDAEEHERRRRDIRKKDVESGQQRLKDVFAPEHGAPRATADKGREAQ